MWSCVSKSFRESLKAIFCYTDIELARSAKNDLITAYNDKKRYEKACETLDEGFEDAFQYTVVSHVHSRLKSTNVLEHLNQEVRRREKIVRIFPNMDSANRLIGWLSGTETDESLKSGFDYYDLGNTYDYFRPSSETAIDASIIKAYEAGEPWVGYSYDPHWIMGKYDMTLLEEPEGENALEALDSQDIQIIGSNSIVERAEDVTDFLKNFTTSGDIANEALIYMEEEDASEYDAAINFLEKNESLCGKNGCRKKYRIV